MLTCDPPSAGARKRQSAEQRLQSWLKEKGFSKREVGELFGLMSDVYLALAAPDPNYPVVAETELQHDRRRERELFEATGEDPFSAVEVQRILDAAEVEELLADLTREERNALYLSLEHDQAGIAAQMGCSIPTVQRRLRSGRRRIIERHGILAQLRAQREAQVQVPALGPQPGEMA